MQCPACSEEVPEEDQFCESCGKSLHAPPPAVPGACACGAGEEDLDADGFCLQCGHRVRRPASDHLEQELSPQFAAVSDRGLRHDRNEDRFAMERVMTGVGEASLMVVCDGVSATRHAEVASAAVAEGVLASMAESLAMLPPADDAGREALLRKAVTAGATRLAVQTPAGANANAPSTTVVAALVLQGVVTVAWVGDSRAYWVDEDQALPLTADHSWMNAVVSAGTLTQEQAAASPQAHAITRWIGADAAADDEASPDVVHFRIPAPGLLLLCTDGLWNYLQTPDVFGSTVHAVAGEGAEALAIARGLVQVALDHGGQDNITVAVLQGTPATHEAERDPK